MESHDYEHYRNLTLMFFFEKLLEKGGNCFYVFLVMSVRCINSRGDYLFVIIVVAKMTAWYNAVRFHT